MKFLPLFIAIALAGTPAEAQNYRTPAGGGEYQIEKTACVTPAQRDEINELLRQNIEELKAKGILTPDWGTPSNGKSQKPTAGTFIWPVRQSSAYNYNSIYGISNYVDLNPAYPNQLLDWNCGTRTYDQASGYNHGGIDIFLWPFSQRMQHNNQAEIIAAAPGIIIAKTDGYSDNSCSLNGQQWNAVYVGNTDGTICWYGHMKKNSLTSVAIGQSVAQGDFLGIVGSSGNSTGPHLHFETHDGSGNVIDPYSGACNTSPSLWAAQKPYYEPTVNALMTHSAVPVFPNCPTLETINAKDTFYVGDPIVTAAYFHDQDDSAVSYRIVHLGTGAATSWTHAPNPGQRYVASYWYWSDVITPQTLHGESAFEATYKGVTTSHKFYVINPATSIASVGKALSGIMVSPNPSNGSFTITQLPSYNKNYTICIRDIAGKIIYRKLHKSDNGRVPITLENAKGMYFLSMEDQERNTTTLKLILQ